MQLQCARVGAAVRSAAAADALRARSDMPYDVAARLRPDVWRRDGDRYSGVVDIDHLARAQTAHVAMSADGAFVGCLTVNPASQELLRVPFEYQPGDVIVGSLCVAEAYRRHGIGQRLMAAARAPPPYRTYLLVLQPRTVLARKDDDDLRTVFRDRVDRLLPTYGRMGFQRACETEDGIVMQG